MTDIAQQKNSLGTPWSLHFNRDGTEDYGIICDANGNEIVASHLPQRETMGNTCWLPEKEGDEMPTLVYQMKLLTAAPKLLDMLKIAIATANPARHKWVKEAQYAIAEATGKEYDQEEAEAARYLHRAAPRMYDALKACEPMLQEHAELARVVGRLLKVDKKNLADQIEEVRREARFVLYDAQGEIAF